MNQNHNHDQGRSTGPNLVAVRFEFDHPTATTVCIAGASNQSEPAFKSMHRSENGHWLKETVLAPGTYEYSLIVDGEWMLDPLAREHAPNPFGGENSILKVSGSPEAAIPPIHSLYP